MRAEIQAIAEEIQQAMGLLRRHLDWDRAKARLAELNARAEDPTLWDDPQRAQKVMRERQLLADNLEAVERLDREVADALGLIELGEAEDDAGVVAEAEASLRALLEEAQRRQVETMLSGEADGNDTYVEVHAGAGGTESQDWAEMLLRMYARWAEQHRFKVEYLEEAAGEEAGLKRATIMIKGANAYGWLKTESGVHRLVRISPFDSNARRHTSFASVGVFPVVDDSIDIDINPADVRTDTYRASGKGGQHVNTTDSAVRLTHIPTGIAVACQSERSQHKNRDTAWKMLKARLYELELEKREAVAQAENSSKTAIGWGHQIRSYVLQPYQLVKDLRTGTESTSPSSVLDGDIDSFLEAALAQRVGGGAVAPIADLD
ncbi:MAG: peptide chain release factor 2 [Bauldia sp.]|nr:peptide chain release factor 2 [Bauldia sp.]